MNVSGKPSKSSLQSVFRVNVLRSRSLTHHCLIHIETTSEKKKKRSFRYVIRYSVYTKKLRRVVSGRGQVLRPQVRLTPMSAPLLTRDVSATNARLVHLMLEMRKSNGETRVLRYQLSRPDRYSLGSGIVPLYKVTMSRVIGKLMPSNLMNCQGVGLQGSTAKTSLFTSCCYCKWRLLLKSQVRRSSCVI
jgi:hypothetical protein